MRNEMKLQHIGEILRGRGKHIQSYKLDPTHLFKMAYLLKRVRSLQGYLTLLSFLMWDNNTHTHFPKHTSI
jgi:hypothetical protein